MAQEENRPIVGRSEHSRAGEWAHVARCTAAQSISSGALLNLTSCRPTPSPLAGSCTPSAFSRRYAHAAHPQPADSAASATRYRRGSVRAERWWRDGGRIRHGVEPRPNSSLPHLRRDCVCPWPHLRRDCRRACADESWLRVGLCMRRRVRSALSSRQHQERPSSSSLSQRTPPVAVATCNARLPRREQQPARAGRRPRLHEQP